MFINRPNFQTLSFQGRRKRQIKGGPNGGGPNGGGSNRGGRTKTLPAASKDYKFEAAFLKKYLALDKDEIISMGHQFDLKESQIGSQIKGLVVRCTYSGGDCLDSG